MGCASRQKQSRKPAPAPLRLFRRVYLGVLAGSSNLSNPNAVDALLPVHVTVRSIDGIFELATSDDKEQTRKNLPENHRRSGSPLLENSFWGVCPLLYNQQKILDVCLLTD